MSEYRYWMTNAPADLDLTTTDTASWVTTAVRLVILHDEFAVEQVARWTARRRIAWRVDA